MTHDFGSDGCAIRGHHEHFLVNLGACYLYIGEIADTINTSKAVDPLYVILQKCFGIYS